MVSTLRFATYNIRLGVQRGVGAVARVVESTAADVVALQEVGRNWTMGPAGDTTQRLAEATGLGHACFAPAIREDTGGGLAEYGHALLSRFPIVEPRLEELPRAVDEPRALLRATVESSPGPIEVIATHLSHVDDRRVQAERLLEVVDDALEAGRPLVVMGDLNDEEAEFVDRLRRWLHDADEELARATFPSDEPARRIDYLFANRPWTDVVVGASPEISDHLAVSATLVLD